MRAWTRATLAAVSRGGVEVGNLLLSGFAKHGHRHLQRGGVVARHPAGGSVGWRGIGTTTSSGASTRDDVLRSPPIHSPLSLASFSSVGGRGRGHRAGAEKEEKEEEAGGPRLLRFIHQLP